MAMINSIRARIKGEVPLWVSFLTLALFIGGFIGGVANFFSTSVWPWQMPVLAHRFLAGAATAYVVGSLLTLRRSRRPESELLMTTTIIYGIFLGAAVATQADVINWGQPIAWLFILLVTFALIITFSFLWQSFRQKYTVENPLSPLLRWYLLGLGILAGGVGLLVYFMPKQAGLVWPWAELATWNTLDSRLVASMLLTIGSGALLAWWRNEKAVVRIFFPMLWGYCVVGGIGLILHAIATPNFVVPDLVYIVIFGLIIISSAILLFIPKRA